MNAKTKAAVIRHGEQLLAIFPQATERDPVALCKKLRALESRGEALGLRLCNGPQFPHEDDANKISEAILAKVNALLGFREAGIPVFVNLDPRGYSLKIDDEWMRAHSNATDHPSQSPTAVCRLHRDWGGYGIIAPDLTNEEG